MKGKILAVTLIILVSFVGIAICQDQKPLPDDLQTLELIENECLLNIDNITLKQRQMQIDFRVLQARKIQWQKRLEIVTEKIGQIAPVDTPKPKKEKEKGMKKDETTK